MKCSNEMIFKICSIWIKKTLYFVFIFHSILIFPCQRQRKIEEGENEENEKNNTWVFIFQKYSILWSKSLEQNTSSNPAILKNGLPFTTAIDSTELKVFFML